METVRTRIAYRPLRIGWVIRSGDVSALRSAVRLSCAFWGGTFNPIVVADRQKEAESLVDLFRPDMLFPIGDSDEVQECVKRFPYLISPFFPDELFLRDGFGGTKSQVLDVHNALVHLDRENILKNLKESGVRLCSWEADDPLADVFMVQFGDYPNKDEIKIDYRGIVKSATAATEIRIGREEKLLGNIFDYPNIRTAARIGVERHYGMRSGWDYPGFFFGNAENPDDLICFWNLRASDIPLLFVDPAHLGRYDGVISHWAKAIRQKPSRRLHKFEEGLAVWTRVEDSDNTKEEILKPFGDHASMVCRVDKEKWNGLNIRPPMMYWSEVSILGVVGTLSGRPRISFELDNKPFSTDFWFHSQHVVASLSFIGGLQGDEQHTFSPPYLPELNEFYSRTMNFEYNKLRSESESLGLIIRVTDESSFINGMPVADLLERVFDLAGFSSKLSPAGLIVRQLITQLGGVGGARAFKIPGVRQLLKTYGPTSTFTKKGALSIIGSAGADSTFKDHERLFIEPRPPKTKLDPGAVFTHLVEKGLFRIGAELTCPNCGMASWTALETLKQRIACELCGKQFDAIRQLVNGVWHYRRSGVLGAEKNAQGAVPVALTLQQFDVNLGGLSKGIYAPSLDLHPKGSSGLPVCEARLRLADSTTRGNYRHHW